MNIFPHTQLLIHFFYVLKKLQNQTGHELNTNQQESLAPWGPWEIIAKSSHSSEDTRANIQAHT